MEIQKRNLVVFIVMLAVAGLFWLLFILFNKGTLNVYGQTPFTVYVSGKSPAVCTATPCSFELSDGNYSVRGTKDKYADRESNAVIKRGKETDVTFNFEYIPVVSDIGKRKVITIKEDGAEEDFEYDLSKTSLAMLQDLELRPLPDNYIDVTIAPSLEYAFFEGGEDFYDYLLDINAGSLRRINLGDPSAYTYAPSNTMYFVEDEDGVSVIKTFVVGSIKDVARFMKPFISPKLFVSGNENFVAIIDTDTDEIFLLNRVENSRTKIATIPGAEDVVFGVDANSLLIGAKIPGQNSEYYYTLYDIETGTLKEDRALIALKGVVTYLDSGSVVYAVSKENSPFEDSLNNILDKYRGGGTSIEVGLNKDSVLTKFDLNSGSFDKLYDAAFMINRVDREGENKVYFGGNGKVFEINFSE